MHAQVNSMHEAVATLQSYNYSYRFTGSAPMHIIFSCAFAGMVPDYNYELS